MLQQLWHRRPGKTSLYLGLERMETVPGNLKTLLKRLKKMIIMFRLSTSNHLDGEMKRGFLNVDRPVWAQEEPHYQDILASNGGNSTLGRGKMTRNKIGGSLVLQSRKWNLTRLLFNLSNGFRWASSKTLRSLCPSGSIDTPFRWVLPVCLLPVDPLRFSAYHYVQASCRNTGTASKRLVHCSACHRLENVSTWQCWRGNVPMGWS